MGRSAHVPHLCLSANRFLVDALIMKTSQTLIKLERWVEAVEFCNRALHINPNSVKALCRRASAFIKLAAESTTGSVAGNVDPSTTTGVTLKEDLTHENNASDGRSGSVDCETEAGTGIELDLDTPATSGEESPGGRNVVNMEFCQRHGGSERLRALALEDLTSAVKIDPVAEDVRHQRDDLGREIEEARVSSDIIVHGSEMYEYFIPTEPPSVAFCSANMIY